MHEQISYQPGVQPAAVTPRGLVVFDRQVPADSAVQAWRLLRSGGDLDDLLQSLLQTFGFRDLPGFAAILLVDGSAQVAVRGAFSVQVDGAQGPCTVDGAGVSTWSERRIPAVTSILVGSADAAAQAVLPVVDGTVLVDALLVEPAADGDAGGGASAEGAAGRGGAEPASLPAVPVQTSRETVAERVPAAVAAAPSHSDSAVAGATSHPEPAVAATHPEAAAAAVPATSFQPELSPIADGPVTVPDGQPQPAEPETEPQPAELEAEAQPAELETEPTPAWFTPTDRQNTEPAQAEPTQADAQPAEPDTEPTPAWFTPTDRQNTEPAQAEPKKADPAPSWFADTDEQSAPTDPATADPEPEPEPAATSWFTSNVGPAEPAPGDSPAASWWSTDDSSPHPDQSATDERATDPDTSEPKTGLFFGKAPAAPAAQVLDTTEAPETDQPEAATEHSDLARLFGFEDPAEPADRADQPADSHPSDQAEARQAGEGAEAGESDQPVEPVEASRTDGPLRAEQPGPAESNQPSESDPPQPAEPAQSAEFAQHVQPAQPAEPAQPGPAPLSGAARFQHLYEETRFGVSVEDAALREEEAPESAPQPPAQPHAQAPSPAAQQDIAATHPGQHDAGQHPEQNEAGQGSVERTAAVRENTSEDVVTPFGLRPEPVDQQPPTPEATPQAGPWPSAPPQPARASVWGTPAPEPAAPVGEPDLGSTLAHDVGFGRPVTQPDTEPSPQVPPAQPAGGFISSVPGVSGPATPPAARPSVFAPEPVRPAFQPANPFQPASSFQSASPGQSQPSPAQAFDEGPSMDAFFGDHDGLTVAGSDLQQALANPAPANPAADDDEAEQVLAVMCGNGHVNPPHSNFCAQCGGRFVEPPRMLPRPPLGALRVSTGEVVQLTASVVVGRNPSASRVAGGRMPILVTVPSARQQISRSHVEIRLEGWNILGVDLRSSNGTMLRRPGQAAIRLTNDPLPLQLGDVLELGDGIRLVLEDLR